MHTHDIIIIGAGIVGSSMALASASLGLRVALCDGQPPQPLTSTLNLRVSNINITTEHFLNTLGVFLEDNDKGIFQQIKVLQQNSVSTLNFSAELLGLPYLGTIIENNRIVNAIQTVLKTYSNVNCYWPIKLEKVALTQDAALVAGQGFGTLSAPLVVAATGSQGTLLSDCGIITEQKSYEQTALIAHIATQKPHLNIAYQRFLTSGPLAYLPLRDQHQCSIVWSSASDHIQQLMALDDKALACEIAQGLNHCLGEVELISSRATFPLIMRHAKQYIAPRIAFIGDAIHTLHPLAGQGANLGIMDVASLIKALRFAKERGRDSGSMTILRRYERERRFANTMMLQAMQLLAQNQPPFPLLRSIGLQVIEHSQQLKRAMIQWVLAQAYLL